MYIRTHAHSCNCSCARYVYTYAQAHEFIMVYYILKFVGLWNFQLFPLPRLWWPH